MDQLEAEMMLVEKLEAQETNLSRKTEVIALEKSEQEDAVWYGAFSAGTHVLLRD